eukprot:TRINITY_DN12812_c0_g2_i1.p1 TRINITY_DN12812_c0_g2~~TRINITY_DN12812_c0_g2_i1.p1  ORF type:complete len:130 (+),score=56.08 TRINITY_DN12812_c0_g2_i1:514-903(+)
MRVEWSENQTKLSNMISTIWSDAEYPWPAGKAPWAREMGGDGIPPYDARGREDGGSTGTMREDEESLSLVLAGMKHHQHPGNNEEAMRMAEVGSMLVTRAMEWVRHQGEGEVAAQNSFVNPDGESEQER